MPTKQNNYEIIGEMKKMIENQHSDNETGYLPITKLTPEQTVIICDEILLKIFLLADLYLGEKRIKSNSYKHQTPKAVT